MQIFSAAWKADVRSSIPASDIRFPGPGSGKLATPCCRMHCASSSAREVADGAADELDAAPPQAVTSASAVTPASSAARLVTRYDMGCPSG